MLRVLAVAVSVGIFVLGTACAAMQASYEAAQAQKAAERQMAGPVTVMTPRGPAQCGMSVAAFDALAVSVDGKTSDEGYETASIAVRTNAMTAYQIKLLLSYLAFDDVKVKFINDACLNLCDPDNLYMLYDQITFSHNKEKLVNCEKLYVAPTADEFADHAK